MTTTLVLLIILWLEAARCRPLAHDSLQLTRNRPCAPIGFVQKTHKLTLRFLESAKLAKKQFERCGGYHRVLYYFEEARDADANSDASSDDMLEAFHSALGKRSVIRFGPADVSVAFGVEWDNLQKMANGEVFMWLRGDAYEITWYELFADDLPPHIRHIWFAEYDVGWTGDLPRLLSSPSLFPPSADFICSTERKPEPGLLIESDWAHFQKRNWLLDAEVRQCLVMLVRYSRRMLATIRSETKMRHFQYSEMTGASICARHGGWCTVGTFNHTHPSVGRDVSSGETMFSWALSLSQEDWENIVARSRPGEVARLYHALKW